MKESELFSSEDNARLRKLLDEIAHPQAKFGLKSSPTIRALMCIPPEDVGDRLFNMLGAVNLIHTLLLSSSFGAAASPYNVQAPLII
jgi:hypothetical protein